MKEDFNAQEYRDNLAHKLRKITDHNKRREALNQEKDTNTEEYQTAEEIHRKEIKDLEFKKTVREIKMPHIAPISKLIEKQFKKEGEPFNPKTVEDILYTFLEQGIGNSRAYESEKYKVSFPFTVVDTAKIAKSLYKQYTPEDKKIECPVVESDVDTETGTENVRHRREFVFGSFQLIEHGNQFTFTEEIIHQIMKDLPRAIEKLKEGIEPDINEVCIIGSPTTLTGVMSPEFLEEVKKNPYGTYGKLYAEFIEATMPKAEDKEKIDMMFYGVSTGASLATETAKQILDAGIVTQSHESSEADNVPYLQVRIDTPPGPRKTSLPKLVGGFAIEAAMAMSDPYTRGVIVGNGAYMKQVNKVAEERGGLKEYMSPEQVLMKKQGIKAVELGLSKGIPIPEGLKVTEVVGLNDLLTYSGDFKEEVKEQRKKAPGTLGANRVSRGENITSYGANMGHSIPFVSRENEIKRMVRAVKCLDQLKES